MSFAESTILFGFHAVRMGFLILRHVVVTLLTFCTCQCNSCAHDFHLHLIFSYSRSNLSIKKRPGLFHSPHYYITTSLPRQSLFFKYTPKNTTSFLSAAANADRRKMYFLHAGCLQHSGTRLNRASGGVNIVHQNHAPRNRNAPVNRKRFLQIPETFLRI